MWARATTWGSAGVLASLIASPFPVIAADPSIHQVVIERESFAFAPQALSIQIGDTVRWTNRDGQMHMVVSAKPDSTTELEIYARLDPQASPVFEHQFNMPASYYYYCAIHFQMFGIIAVNP